MKLDERIAYFAKLINEHSDLAAREFERTTRKLDEVQRELSVIKKMIAQGAQMDFPWFHIKGDVTRHKGAQVGKVWKYMKEHPDCDEYPAIVATFVEDPLGYEKISSLVSACRRYHVKDFLGC